MQSANISDILYIFCYTLSFKEHSTLARVNKSFSSFLNKCCSDQLYWKKKAELNFHIFIEARYAKINWKSVCRILYSEQEKGYLIRKFHNIKKQNFLLQQSVCNLKTEILGSLGSFHCPNICKLLLTSGSSDSEENNNSLNNFREYLSSVSKFTTKGMNSKALTRKYLSVCIELIKVFVQSKELDKINPNILPSACSKGYLDLVEILLEDSIIKKLNIGTKRSNLFIDHRTSNDFIPYHPTYSYNALLGAVKSDNLKILEILLNNKNIVIHESDNWIFAWACEKGRIGAVKLLLKDSRFNPSINDNLAIRNAANNGHHDIVKLLMQDSRIDPSSCYMTLVNWSKYPEITELLVTDSRVQRIILERRIIIVVIVIMVLVLLWQYSFLLL